jgi:Rrf2 family protein
MISTKSKYGIRALLYMAIKGMETKISIKEIAEEENISGRYLEQIFSVLKQGNIVKSVKGASGGYIFSKDIKEITIKELIELLEKDIYCEIDEKIEVGTLEGTLNELLWKEYNKKLEKFFGDLTLETLVIKHKESKNLMYYI